MATRMYIQLGDIKGTSKDQEHADWIEIESFSYGVSNAGDAVAKAKGDASGEACSHQNILCTKPIDKTSPLLYAYCSVGKLFPAAELHVFEEKDKLFSLKLENAMLASVGVGGTKGAGVPNESFSVAFSKVEWGYRSEAPQHWDLLTNSGSVEK